MSVLCDWYLPESLEQKWSSLPDMAEVSAGYTFPSPPRPFTVSFSDDEVKDLYRRLRNARFPTGDLHADHDVDENGPPDLYGTSGEIYLLSKLSGSARTRWLMGRGTGPTLSWMKKFTKLWSEGYDWRKDETELNKYEQTSPCFEWVLIRRPLPRYPQFKVDIDGLDVHFVHQRSKLKGAIPLMLIHGWLAGFISPFPSRHPDVLRAGREPLPSSWGASTT